MKRILSLAVAASMLLSAIPAMAETATKATYIPAPYNAEEVNPTKTYLEPVFYQNENGPTIGVTTVGVIQQDGLYFKDSDNDHELDAFEDWRLPAEERAADMVTKMTLTEQAGFVLNALMVMPGSKTLADVKNEDGTINPAKVMTVIPEGETTKSLIMLNSASSSFASLDDQVMSIGKIRAGVYRGGLNYDASVVALYNNVTTAFAEWDSAKAGTPAIPVTLISNPISAGFPDSLGMAAAVLGDGNYDAIKDYAEVDRQMWRSQGIIFMYGPQIDLVTDPRWPRNSGTYGERPDVTAGIITALVDGYQYGKDGVNEKSVVLSAKHFPGEALPKTALSLTPLRVSGVCTRLPVLWKSTSWSASRLLLTQAWAQSCLATPATRRMSALSRRPTVAMISTSSSLVLLTTPKSSPPCCVTSWASRAS